MRHALDLTDRDDVAAWLDAMGKAHRDLVDAATEATRSRRERTLSRAELRRRVDDASGRIADLLDAARRGVGPMPAGPAGDRGTVLPPEPGGEP
jgi:hypothetical protein